MIVTTKHGDFEVKEFSREERRKHFRKIKEVSKSGDLLELHDLGDEFALYAFDDPDESLKGLTALQEEDVLMAIISQYFGLDLNLSGD